MVLFSPLSPSSSFIPASATQHSPAGCLIRSSAYIFLVPIKTSMGVTLAPMIMKGDSVRSNSKIYFQSMPVVTSRVFLWVRFGCIWRVREMCWILLGGVRQYLSVSIISNLGEGWWLTVWRVRDIPIIVARGWEDEEGGHSTYLWW